ncbi:hypothetical protein [Ferrovum myxofaciens]|uniref:hypothetical protein n=1 Tax=Ferrovum myxofaciens TaxID=416213 RepID=UPI0018D39282|nr:hypothetical protein [Ferrovum myxofaciens]
MPLILYINPHPHAGDPYAVIELNTEPPLKQGLRTQKEAEDWAKKNHPDCSIHLQRVEKTNKGKAPHWRKCD